MVVDTAQLGEVDLFSSHFCLRINTTGMKVRLICQDINIDESATTKIFSKISMINNDV